MEINDKYISIYEAFHTNEKVWKASVLIYLLIISIWNFSLFHLYNVCGEARALLHEEKHSFVHIACVPTYTYIYIYIYDNHLITLGNHTKRWVLRFAWYIYIHIYILHIYYIYIIPNSNFIYSCWLKVQRSLDKKETLGKKPFYLYIF